ncbi:cytochrome b/b6 domain-containing protein [Rhodovulum sp. DZ06]|uniref:cytochrome b/b6 domain-containing protein n=1 Tax=Rhodovulum sp. DZ06 TaxID=3425126 RepID=UPI003D33DCF9
MTAAENMETGREGARSVRAWDPLVRLLHWTLVTAILLNAVVLEEESRIHEYVGWIALGVVVTRMAWGLIGSKPARLRSFLPNPRAALRHGAELLRGEKTVHLSHNPIGALMVWNLWACIGGLAATGYMMGTIQFFGMEWVEELHEAIFGWLIASIVLHLGGVLLDALLSGDTPGAPMTRGRRRIPDGARVE